MNHPQHSPGPWIIDTREHVHAIQDSNRQDLTYQDTTPQKDYGSITSRGRSKIETLANARLIAAAPELLEALARSKNELEDLSFYLESQCIFGTWKATIEKARAAIAKATGDAQK